MLKNAMWLCAWVFGAIGCSQNFSDQEPPAAMAERGFTARSAPPASTTPAYSLGQANERQALGPLSAVAPKGWVAQQPSSSMRLAQYGLPGPAGEATLGVFFFGPGQGGSVQANIERWNGQFKQEDGQPSEGRRWTRQVGDIEIIGLDVSGTFSDGMGMGNATPQAGYRMLGAIAVHSLGTVFFKVTGPAQTVEHWAASFDEFLNSLQAGT